MAPGGRDGKFDAGDVDTFTIPAVDLGDLTQIIIGEIFKTKLLNKSFVGFHTCKWTYEQQDIDVLTSYIRCTLDPIWFEK